MSRKKGDHIDKIIAKDSGTPKSGAALKQALVDLCSEYFVSKDGKTVSFKSDFKKMKAGLRMSAMIELAKHVTPKAKDQAELEYEQAATSALRRRLFGEE